MTAHFQDVRDSYAKSMEFHGYGLGLMHPIAGNDCVPVSAGYFDRNGDWNLIAKLSSKKDPNDCFVPLAYEPVRVRDINIQWQPKVSFGVEAINLDGSGSTPEGLIPGGADAHIKYTTKNKFGAVLMTCRPITLCAYNDERLFSAWLEANKERLYASYGTELKKYGLWIVTRTYNCPKCSINAWVNKNHSAIVSAKAKANMLGELGEQVGWEDKLTDKDWSHYSAKNDAGLVVFLDGIQVKPLEWKMLGLLKGWHIKAKANKAREASRTKSYSVKDDLTVPPPHRQQSHRVPAEYLDEDQLDQRAQADANDTLYEFMPGRAPDHLRQSGLDDYSDSLTAEDFEQDRELQHPNSRIPDGPVSVIVTDRTVSSNASPHRQPAGASSNHSSRLPSRGGRTDGFSSIQPDSPWDARPRSKPSSRSPEKYPRHSASGSRSGRDSNERSARLRPKSMTVGHDVLEDAGLLGVKRSASLRRISQDSSPHGQQLRSESSLKGHELRHELRPSNFEAQVM